MSRNSSTFSRDYRNAKANRSVPRPRDIDYNSKMGYSDGSPFSNRPFMDINTPSGYIDMSNTGIPLFANGYYLPPYSGQHYMGTNMVREIPANDIIANRFSIPIPRDYKDLDPEFSIHIPKSYKDLDPGFSINTGKGTAIPWPTTLRDDSLLTAGDYNRMRGLKPGLFKSGGWLDKYQTKGEVKFDLTPEEAEYLKSHPFNEGDEEFFGDDTHDMFVKKGPNNTIASFKKRNPNWKVDKTSKYIDVPLEGSDYDYAKKHLENSIKKNYQDYLVDNLNREVSSYTPPKDLEQYINVLKERKNKGENLDGFDDIYHYMTDNTQGKPLAQHMTENYKGYNPTALAHYLKENYFLKKEGGWLKKNKKAYGGDPSLPGITGHYPFGGQYTKTHTHFKTGGWLDLPVAQTGLQNELNPDADPRFKLVRPEDKKANEVVFDVDPFTGKARQRDYVNLDEISVSPKTEIEEKDKEWRANAAKYSMEDWFNKYMPNIGLARAMGVNPNNLSDQQKQEYRKFIDTKTAEDIMRRKPLQGQSELDYANWFKNLTQGEQDLISRTSYAGRGMLDTPAKFQGIDFAKARAANRMLESVNAEKEDLFGNPNWRDVLRRRTQATGDKLSLRRIPGIGEYIPEILDVTGDIGRMASALGASPAEAQEQNSIMPYITAIGNPIVQGTIGKALNPKATNLQFLNEMVNPLAGLTEYGVKKAAGLGRKLKGSKVASGVAGFKPVDLSAISGTINEPVPMASLKGNTPPLSPAQALENRFNELNKLNLENRNITSTDKFFDEIFKLQKQGKVSENLTPEQLKEILLNNPNIKTEEKYVSFLPKDESRTMSEIAKEQDELFGEGVDFSKEWMYTDSKKADDLVKELELNKKVKYSAEDQARLDKLDDEIRKLQWSSNSNVHRDKINNLWDEINAIKDSYYETHSNKIQALEDELFGLIRPEFKQRLTNVYELANPGIANNTGFGSLKNRILTGSKSMGRRNDPVLLRFGEESTLENFNKLSADDKLYLSENAPVIGGARTDDNTITLGEHVYRPDFRLVEPAPQKIPARSFGDLFSNPMDFIRGYRQGPAQDPYLLKNVWLTPKDAMDVVGTNVHEIGHNKQRAYTFSDILAQYDPKYKYYSHVGTPFGNKFGQHLIDPVEASPNAQYDLQTWLSSGNEIHSQTDKSRFLLYNDMINAGVSPKEAMRRLQNPSDETLDLLISRDLGNGNVDAHFKPNTPQEVKRNILRNYMPAIGGVGLGIYGIDQLIDQGQEPTLSNKYGGTPRKLSKKSTSKNIKSSINKIMARNTTLYGDSGKAYYEPNVKPYYKSGGWLDKLPVAQFGKVKGNPVSDWWYNTEDVQNTYKMAPDVDPFLKDWLLHPETQRRLKENLSSSVLTRDINPNNLTKTAIKRLYSLPMFSRELVRNKGVTASDIEYNNELQGWKTPSTILGNPYYSGDPNELGVYMPDYHVSMVNSFNQPGVITHEQTHATGPFQDAMEDVIRSKFFDKKDPDKRFVKEWGTGLTNYDLKKGVKEPTYEEVKNKYPGIYKEWQSTEEYLDRDGMYPRIMDIRRTLKLKPGQKVNKSILDNKSIANPLLDLRHYYDDDTIINMLNTLAKTQSIEKPTTAKYGGWLDDN